MRRSRLYAFILLFTVILLCFFLPFTLIISGSFMSVDEVSYHYSGVFSGFDTQKGFAKLHFIPEFFSFSQYRQLLLETPDYLFAFWNSIILLVPILIGNLIIAPLAGFALAKYDFAGKHVILTLYILLAILPHQTMIVPNYIMFSKLNLLGSRITVWASFIFHPLGTFICWRWIAKLPSALLESAEVDGANHLQMFFYIICPLSKPAVSTMMVIVATDIWNAIEHPLVFLGSVSQHPLSVVFATLSNENIGIAFAGGVLFSMPLILLFFMCKDDFLLGLDRIIVPKNEEGLRNAAEKES